MSRGAVVVMVCLLVIIPERDPVAAVPDMSPFPTFMVDDVTENPLLMTIRMTKPVVVQAISVPKSLAKGTWGLMSESWNYTSDIARTGVEKTQSVVKAGRNKVSTFIGQTVP